MTTEMAASPPMDDVALAVARRFLATDATVSVRPLGKGLINETFRVDAPAGTFVLQCINTHVFPDPSGIMANLGRLEALQGMALELGLRLPRLITADDGSMLLRDGRGKQWRLMEYIANSRALTRIDNPTQAREIGRVLGAFHRLTAALDPDQVAVTLAGFHDTPTYLDQLYDALRTASNDDPAVAAALDFIEARRRKISVLAEAHRHGLLPLRVTHGDPKIDNLLFAADTDQALCLIDLDTVQPGLVHHDIGDCLRSCCKRHADEDLGSASFDLTICRDILSGYAAASRGLLDAAEVALLYPAIHLLPLELAIRFLTDHLQGDVWFRIREPGQNLVKARVQLSLVADIEAKETALRRIISDCFRGTEQ